MRTQGSGRKSAVLIGSSCGPLTSWRSRRFGVFLELEVTPDGFLLPRPQRSMTVFRPVQAARTYIRARW